MGRLNEGWHRKLTLISAPAGFGKTTLVSAWLAGCNRKVAWLSLDEGDSDPARFLTYLVATLRVVAADLGEGVLRALQSPQPPSTEAILTTLLNEIATIPHNFVLVLDDYHLIDAGAVDDAITFLIEHQPPQMHLVITTREDPQLPLARLRVRGQVTELRAADLRFTAVETATFLNEIMGLDLSAADVTALEARTEGWIAGLQLAALSMRGREDIPGFIRAFAGDHRYIADYLVEEVLESQPEAVRRFLLQTSILDRLNGPLCDAVTGQQEGGARLAALERGNFFVVPLDDRRHWYRYHHLFAEVLQAHLHAEQPDLVPTLHRRASVWFERHGSAAEAIRHSLTTQDFERVADLAEREIPAVRRTRQEPTLLGWLKALPDELIRVRPVLSVWYAHAALSCGELAGVEDRLRDAEHWLDTPAGIPELPDAPAAAMVVLDNEEFRRLPGAIAVARAGQAMALGDVAGTVKHAQRVLDLVPEDDHVSRGAAAGFLGLAHWTNGDLEEAHRTFAEGMAAWQKMGYISDAVGGATVLADIRIAQGRLRQAMRTYEHALQLATAQHPEGVGPVLRGTSDMHVGISELLIEQNELDAATQHLQRSNELGEHTGFPRNPFRWRVAMARVREAQGDLDGALDLLDDAERVYVSDFFPNVRPVAAFKTRVWLAQGRLAEAISWAREQGLSANDELSYLREFEHIILARVMLAQHKNDGSGRSMLDATTLLERLLKAAEAGGRTGSVIEILVLQALALQIQGDDPAALAPLERALRLAGPEGYVRIFVDEGQPMAQLLLEAATRGIMPAYTGKLLAASEAAQQSGPQHETQRSAGESPLPASPAAQPMIEPLSQRELDVLRLFKTELTGPEIADALMIGLSTVRTHTKGIYSKLNVTSRRAAVLRAEELNLI